MEIGGFTTLRLRQHPENIERMNKHPEHSLHPVMRTREVCLHRQRMQDTKLFGMSTTWPTPQCCCRTTQNSFFGWRHVNPSTDVMRRTSLALDRLGLPSCLRGQQRQQHQEQQEQQRQQELHQLHQQQQRGGVQRRSDLQRCLRMRTTRAVRFPLEEDG